MELREFVETQSKKNPSKHLTEEQVLQEGIKFFKDSKRLQKLADKVGHEAFKKGGKKGYEEVEEIVKKITEIGKEFAQLEEKFNEAEDKKEKEKIKKEHKELKEKYKELIGMIKQGTFTTLLKSGFKISLLALPIAYAFSAVSVFGDALESGLEKAGREGAANLDPKMDYDVLKQTSPEAVEQRGNEELSRRGREMRSDVLDKAETRGSIGAKSGLMKKLQNMLLKIASVTGAMTVIDFAYKKFTDAGVLKETKEAMKSLEKKQSDYLKSEE